MYIANSTGGLMLQTMLYLANYSNKDVSLYNIPPAPASDINDIRCYGVYGCFPLNGLWITNTRQINVHPDKPSKIRPNFAVFTSKSVDRPSFIDLNDPETVRYMGINPKGKIFLISHGYLEAGDRPWMRDMTKALLSHEPAGSAAVIVIDWGGGSSPPYVQAVANIRLVGAITAHVIHLIYEELQMQNLDNVHFIGHSLGAHLAGYAGSTLQRDFNLKLGRISGLDPAEPLFGETPNIVRLDKTDAKYVDIIHTDANPLMSGGLGMLKPIGHVDFYPNGGYDNPGCGGSLEEYMRKNENSIFWTMQQFLGCNHIRSYQYFTETINAKGPWTGITCDSFEAFEAGQCFECFQNGHHCLKFGYDSIDSYNELINGGVVHEQTPLVAYLRTGSETPFRRLHYRVTVKVSSSDESTLHGGEIGTLSIDLHSHYKKSSGPIPFSIRPMFFEPGFQYTKTIGGKDVGDAIYVTATWDYETSLLNPLTWRILSSPRIFVDYIVIEFQEHETVLKLCPYHGTPIISGTPSVFQEKYCSDYV